MIKKLLVWWRERHKRRWLKGLARKHGYESYAELQDAAEYSRTRFQEYMEERCAGFAYVTNVCVETHPYLDGISASDSIFRERSYPACTWKCDLAPKYVMLGGRKMGLPAGRTSAGLVEPRDGIWDPAVADYEYNYVTFEIQRFGVGWLQENIRVDWREVDSAANDVEKKIEAWARAVIADALKVRS
jgi:hypothetical protein